MKFLSSTKTAIILLIIAAILLGVCICVAVRPISYGLGYYNKSTYAGREFQGVMKFNADNTMTNRNTNFDIEMKSYYYYKDGYIFYTLAETDKEYAEEVKWIDENFAEASATPFYASKINAFKIVAVGIDDADGYDTSYTCIPVIIFVVACGVVDLVLIGLACVSFVLSKKAKYKE